MNNLQSRNLREDILAGCRKTEYAKEGLRTSCNVKKPWGCAIRQIRS